MKIYEKLKNTKLSQEVKKLISNIEKYGLGIIHILRDETGPEYSFTIGLFDNFKHPEMTIIGLPKEVSHQILNNLGEQIKSGKKYESNIQYEGLIKRYKCHSKKVAKKYYKEYFGSALWYYNGNKFPVIQIVWPDKNKYYPWDSNFNEDFKWFQPVLDS